MHHAMFALVSKSQLEFHDLEISLATLCEGFSVAFGDLEAYSTCSFLISRLIWHLKYPMMILKQCRVVTVEVV